jgi:hypothetical protein
MKLYEIADKIEMILAQGLNLETGEIEEEAAQALEELEEEQTEVGLEIGRYIKGLRCEATAVNDEAVKLKLRASALNKRADSLNSYLERFMPQPGEKLRSGKSTKEVACSSPNTELLWKSSKSVVVDNEAELATKYFRKKTVTTLDKAAMNKDLRDGEEVKGAHLQVKTWLDIK